MLVLGVGEKKTPPAFQSACSQFILTESLRPAAHEGDFIPKVFPKPSVKAGKKNSVLTVETLRIPMGSVLGALKQVILDNEWATMAVFGSKLREIFPGFDYKLYGYKNLTEMVKAHPHLFVFKYQKIKMAKGGAEKKLAA